MKDGFITNFNVLISIHIGAQLHYFKSSASVVSVAQIIILKNSKDVTVE